MFIFILESLGASEIIVLIVLGFAGFFGIRFLMKRTSSKQRNIEGNNSQSSSITGNLQCPNCGGFKYEKLGTFSRLVGKIFYYGFLLAFSFFIGGFLGAFFGNLLPVIQMSVVGLTCVICVGDFFTTFRPGRVNCLLCGFNWRKLDYPSGMQFQVRQDLIEKGNIRLEQERLKRERQRREEEQRRQQGLQ